MHFDVYSLWIVIQILSQINANVLGRALEEYSKVLACLTLRNASSAITRKLVIEWEYTTHVELKVTGCLTKTPSFDIFSHRVLRLFILKHFIVLALVVNVVFVDTGRV